MREYASLKLREANEEDLVEERCLEYYRTRCLASADQARYGLLEWLAWVDLEIDNIRAVLQRCIARGDLARGLGYRRLARLLLDHSRDHGKRPLARPTPCGGRRVSDRRRCEPATSAGG